MGQRAKHCAARASPSLPPSLSLSLTADIGTAPVPPRRGRLVGGGSAGVAVGVEARAAAGSAGGGGGAPAFAPAARPPKARWGMRGGAGARARSACVSACVCVCASLPPASGRAQTRGVPALCWARLAS